MHEKRVYKNARFPNLWYKQASLKKDAILISAIFAREITFHIQKLDSISVARNYKSEILCKRDLWNSYKKKTNSSGRMKGNLKTKSPNDNPNQPATLT